MEERARQEMAENPRYTWLGNRPQWQVRRLLKRCHLMVLSSEMEGGANVVSEALVAGTAILSTRISGSIGMLGEDHPGYFEVGETAALAALLERAETEPSFVRQLEERSRCLAPLFHPDREREAWKALLDEL
jgi:glycosyltransferase involved in cell wall biosynthesis